MKKIEYICDICQNSIIKFILLATQEEVKDWFYIDFVVGGMKKHICEKCANKINYTIDETMRITEELQEM